MCDQQPMKIHQEEGKYLLSVTEKQYSVLLLANLFEEGKKHCKDDDYIQIIKKMKKLMVVEYEMQ